MGVQATLGERVAVAFMVNTTTNQTFQWFTKVFIAISGLGFNFKRYNSQTWSCNGPDVTQFHNCEYKKSI